MQIPYSALIAYILAPLAAATNVPGVAEVSVNRVSHQGLGRHAGDLQRRADTGHPVLDTISNQRYYYMSNADIGTPPQRLNLLMDTGSSDTWVFTSQTQSQNGRRSNANSQTSLFDSSQSHTFHNNGTDWQIQYGKGQASGTWGTDAFSLGETKLNSLSIGLANSVSQISTGLIGLGRPQAEITYNKGGQMYENLPLRLQAEGVIGAAAYSLALGDLNGGQGTILFGGVDHDRYEGAMAELPVVHPKHFGVQLSSIKADERATYELISKPSTAILDSGTSLSYVDGDTLSAIRTAFNANPSFALGERYYSDCNITKALHFTFGGNSIAVPAYNFMWPISMFVDGVTESLDFPQNSCYLGFEQSSSDENFILLGDNVLRGMYLVYDISSERVGIAKEKPSSGSPQVEAITPGQPIPGTNAARQAAAAAQRGTEPHQQPAPQQQRGQPVERVSAQF